MNQSSKKQVGGSHYLCLPSSPYKYIRKNFGPGHFIGCVIKYASRYFSLKKIKDLEKIIQYCEMEIEFLKEEQPEPQIEGKD